MRIRSRYSPFLEYNHSQTLIIPWGQKLAVQRQEELAVQRQRQGLAHEVGTELLTLSVL